MEQTTTANGIELCYETFGDASHPAVLFVMGLGGQMIAWPQPYMDAFSAAGYYVIRFDNRDVGLSQKFAEAGAPDFDALVADLMAGKPAATAYKLSDMAADAVGLLDQLGVQRAHVIGVSMGGMIAQQMAIDSGERMLSMISIMSSTGDPSLPPPTAEAMAVLTLPPPPEDRAALVEHLMNNRRAVGGDGFVDDAASRAQTERVLERQFYPVGTARQRAAVMASGARTAALGQLDLPTLVIHGDKDPLVPLAAGEHTAATIPGARLEIVAGMGHAQFPSYQPKMIELMLGHVQAQTSRG